MSVRKVIGYTLTFLQIAVFSNSARAEDVPLQSTCDDVKTLLSNHQVVEWGPGWECRAPTATVAEEDAAWACVAVVAQGSPVVLKNIWQVKNWWMFGSIQIELPGTFLGYCAGMYAPGAITTLSPNVAKADEARKQLQEALEALRSKAAFAGLGDVYIPQCDRSRDRCIKRAVTPPAVQQCRKTRESCRLKTIHEAISNSGMSAAELFDRRLPHSK